MSPQSTPELRSEWADPQGGVTDQTAIRFLESRGYKATRGFTWLRPNRPEGPTDKELRAIQFLIEEFDWGGLEDPRTYKRHKQVDERTEIPLDEIRALLIQNGLEVPAEARFWVDRRRDILVMRVRREERS